MPYRPHTNLSLTLRQIDQNMELENVMALLEAEVRARLVATDVLDDEP